MVVFPKFLEVYIQRVQTEKNLISASKINKNIFKKIETTLSNYYLEKIERKRKTTDFNLKLIGRDLIQETNQYLKENRNIKMTKFAAKQNSRA